MLIHEGRSALLANQQSRAWYWRWRWLTLNSMDSSSPNTPRAEKKEFLEDTDRAPWLMGADETTRGQTWQHSTLGSRLAIYHGSSGMPFMRYGLCYI